MLLDNMTNDDEIVQDCCWGLCSILDNAEEDVISMVIGHELQVYLQKFLFMEKGGVAMACMRALGNIGFSQNNDVLKNIMTEEFLRRIVEAVENQLSSA